MCTKNTALGDVFREEYSTQLCLVLYFSLDRSPCAVFSVQTLGSALSSIVASDVQKIQYQGWGQVANTA